jgi:hypothetical protein
MDNTKQVYMSEATGWQRGLYEDIEQITGLVGSIWRTLMYHEPRFVRYAWGQIKPVFQTREFAAFSIALRDNFISAAEPDLPRYDAADVDLDPSEFTELREQLSRNDFLATRYYVIHHLLHHRLHGGAVGTETAGYAATAPAPEEFSRVRGRPLTLLSQDEARARIPGSPYVTPGEFGEMVPSEYRCIAQWPTFLDRAWSDLKPITETDAFETAVEDSYSLVDTFFDRLQYTPKLTPDTLAAMGFSEETIAELQELFSTFRAGGRGVIPLSPLYAATVDAAGERHGLTFPESIIESVAP